MAEESQEPDVVYHYTSMNTLLKIFQSSCLWASNIRYLNDHSERQFYIDQLLARIPAFLKANPNAQKDCFERFMDEAGATPPFDELPFVTSFSKHADSLPQWRSYCSGGNGVSIGFRTSSIRAARLSNSPPVSKKWAIVPSISFKEVSYLKRDDLLTLDRIIAGAILTAEKELEEFDPVEFEPGQYESPPPIEELLWYSLEVRQLSLKTSHSKKRVNTV